VTIPEKKRRGRPRTTEPAEGPLQAQDSPAFDAPASVADRRKKSVSVIQRRLKGGTLFSAPSQQTPLKNKMMRTRWFNRGISDDRFFVAENQRGWIKVHRTDVESLDAVSGYDVTSEGYITRGPRGQEMLYMMDKRDYEAIQAAKQAANTKRLASARTMRDATADAAAAQFGDEAGDFIAKDETVLETWRGPDG